jgi:SAM-dependent methyltransferase
MNLIDLVRREAPQPWTEGDNIPWNEPGFSRRMLREHLSQDHDAASRRFATIDRHARFIHEHLLKGKLARVLDMGCGPGLYAERLARLGHAVHGVDFSPASIQYAREAAAREGLSCTFDLADLRAADFGPDGQYDMAMLLYGEFSVFRPADIRAVLRKARAALRPGGLLLMEPSEAAAVKAGGKHAPEWYTQDGGLFSEQPHLVLEEAFWDDASQAATHRYYVIDAASGSVERYAASYQAYSDADLTALLESCGFEQARFYPNLTGEGERGSGEFFALTAVAG